MSEAIFFLMVAALQSPNGGTTATEVHRLAGISRSSCSRFATHLGQIGGRQKLNKITGKTERAPGYCLIQNKGKTAPDRRIDELMLEPEGWALVERLHAVLQAR